MKMVFKNVEPYFDVYSHLCTQQEVSICSYPLTYNTEDYNCSKKSNSILSCILIPVHVAGNAMVFL